MGGVGAAGGSQEGGFSSHAFLSAPGFMAVKGSTERQKVGGHAPPPPPLPVAAGLNCSFGRREAPSRSSSKNIKLGGNKGTKTKEKPPFTKYFSITSDMLHHLCSHVTYKKAQPTFDSLYYVTLLVFYISYINILSYVFSLRAAERGEESRNLRNVGG